MRALTSISRPILSRPHAGLPCPLSPVTADTPDGSGEQAGHGLWVVHCVQQAVCGKCVLCRNSALKLAEKVTLDAPWAGAAGRGSITSGPWTGRSGVGSLSGSLQAPPTPRSPLTPASPPLTAPCPCLPAAAAHGALPGRDAARHTAGSTRTHFIVCCSSWGCRTTRVPAAAVAPHTSTTDSGLCASPVRSRVCSSQRDYGGQG